MSSQAIRSIVFSSLAGLLFACAEGGTSGTGFNGDPVVTFGVIKEKTATTVTINKQVYSTTQSTVTIDGKAKPVADLQNGMIAKVNGNVSPNSRVANSIAISNTVVGPIEQLQGSTSFVINGIRVHIDVNTKHSSRLRLNDLTNGKQVAVMGLVQVDGKIVATYISDDLTDGYRAVSGFMSNVNTETKTFKVGAVSVSYASLSVPSAQQSLLTEQRYVKVEGEFDANQVFIAKELEFEFEFEIESLHQSGSGSDDHGVEFEGFLTQGIDANNQIVLWGKTIKVTATTVFERGTSSDLTAGNKVHVRASIIDGAIVATKIEFESSSTSDLNTDLDKTAVSSGNAILESHVVAVNAAQSSFELAAFSNTSIKWDGTTRWIGTSSTSLQNNNSVRVTVDASTMIASEVLLESAVPRNKIEFTGQIQEEKSSSVVILNQEIDLTIVETDAPNLATFMQWLTTSSVVKIEGDFENNAVVWKKIDLL